VAETSNTRFGSLTLHDWRQFDELSIDFHPRLTVLTGANASGKSTVLALLAKHFNWSRVYSSAPLREGTKRRWSVFGRRRSQRPEASEGWGEVGTLVYSDGLQTAVNVAEGRADMRTQYDVQLPHQRPVTGVFLISHRAVAGTYTQVSTIPTSFGDSEQAFEQFTNEIRTR